ncbi:MAG: Rieske 2Fe-2S domain-containing protein [Actinomycetota bacterium]
MKGERAIAVCFVVSAIASAGLLAVYFLGGGAPAEGVLLGIALGALGIGFVVWSVAIAVQDEVEERGELSSPPGERAAAEAAAEAGGVTRRAALKRLLMGALAVLGAAFAVPALSLGPLPGQSLSRTKWSKGARVVDGEGNPMRAEELGLETVHTVFPQSFEGEADSQAVLVKVPEELLELDEDAAAFAPGGVVAYSKICTHAGCPVGLYRADAHELLCPCHQSTSDVLRGAVPTYGPAARPLPQLPLGIDDEGMLIALGDFLGPAGPSFWNMSGEDAS